jgi:hypothetical protein
MSRNVFVTAIAIALAACANRTDAGSAPLADGSPVALLDFVAIAPKAWTAKPPESTMRLAEYELPASAGDADTAEAVVYYFGPGQGGDVDSNVARWRAQFSDESGNPPDPVITKIDNVSFSSTLVEFHGKYNRGIGMGGQPSEAKSDQVLLAAIVETPKGNLYVQAYGPSAGVLAQKDAFLSFVRSIRAHPANGEA